MFNKIENSINKNLDTIVYSSRDYTVKIKEFVLLAFKEFLYEDSETLINCLCNNSRSGNLTRNIFQRFSQILEKNLPFSFTKYNKAIYINSLLDPNLNIFDGISTFTQNNLKLSKNNELIIKNNTYELFKNKSYFIGKLLSVTSDNQDITNLVKYYSFNKIYLENIGIGIDTVTVSHLRIIPHYQTGPLVYIHKMKNSIKKLL